MKASCPGPDLLLLLEQGLLDEEDGSEVELRAHLDGCSACQASVQKVEKALAAPPLPFPPSEVLPALHERLAANVTGKAPLPFPDQVEGVHLLCTYCKDALQVAETVYCASCLAPHHGDCFAEHGRCSAHACEGRDVVRSSTPPTQPTRLLRGGKLPLLALVLAGGAVAALTLLPGSDPAPALPIVPTPTKTPKKPTESRDATFSKKVYPLGGLLDTSGWGGTPAEPGWVQDYRQRLDSQRVSLSFDDTTFGEAIDFLQDITGLNFTVGPEVDIEDVTVTLRLREVALADALKLMLEQTGLTMTFQDETIRFGSQQGATRVVVEPVHPQQWPVLPEAQPKTQEPSPGQVFLTEVRRRVLGTLGSGAWDDPALIALQGDTLVVFQTDEAHAQIQSYLENRRGPEMPQDLANAWFFPSLSAIDPPAAVRAREYARQAESQQVTLNFDQTPFDEVLEFLRGATRIPIRVSPDAQALIDAEDVEVSLRLRNISLRNAVRLIAASHEALVWDVDRSGFLLRTGATKSLEARLQSASSAAFRNWRTGGEETLAKVLRERRVTLNFPDTPFFEVMDFMRDITGLNYVISRGLVDEEQVVSLRAKDIPLAEALERILSPLDLGYVVDQGVVRIASKEKATAHLRIRAKAKELLARPFGKPLRGVTLAAVAERLQVVTGAYVHLGATARGSRARVLVPAGQTCGETLGLLGEEASLRWAWGAVGSERSLALALDVDTPEALIGALQALVSPSRWEDAPAPARDALESTRSGLRDVLKDLANLGTSKPSSGEASSGRLRAVKAARETLARRLRAVKAARERLVDVLAGHRILVPASARPNPEGTIVRVERQVFFQLQSAIAESVAARSALSEEDAKQAAALQEVGRKLQSLTRKDPEFRALYARRSDLLNEQSKARRDLQLQLARLESQAAMLRSRLKQVGCPLPSLAASVTAKRERLVAGEAWALVFPAGFQTWWTEQSKQAKALQEGGFRVQDRLGFTLAKPTPEDAVVLGSVFGLARLAGLRPGDRLLKLGEREFSGPFEFLEALGASGQAGRPVMLAIARGDVRLTLRLPLGPFKEAGHLPFLTRDGRGPSKWQVVVDYVPDGGPALHAEDWIVAVDGIRTKSTSDLGEVVGSYRAGVEVELTVQRAGRTWTLKVALAEHAPAGPPPPPLPPMKASPEPEPPAEPETLLSARRKRPALQREGGSAGTVAAVQAALGWLKRHQHKDGHWDSEWAKACAEKGCSGPGTAGGGKRYGAGLTAQALLAFMGHGETHKVGAYKDTVDRGLRWLVAQQKEDGSIGFTHGEEIYNHAFATQALCEAYGLSDDSTFRAPAQKALDWCLKAQNPGLGWKYGIKTGRNDTSVTAVMVQAIYAAKLAGLKGSEKAEQGALRWLKRATNSRGDVGYETPGGGSAFLAVNDGKFSPFPVMTAAGIHARILLGERRSTDENRRGARLVLKTEPRWLQGSFSHINFYYWHLGTSAMFQTGGTKWRDWNRAMQTALLPNQRIGDCADGSWDPVGEWCVAGGRVYATAINALTLETYTRFGRAQSR